MTSFIPFCAAIALVLMTALLQGEELPSSVQVLIPLVVIAINFIAAKTPLGEKYGKRNITAVASLPLAVLAVYLMGSSLPSFPTRTGELLAWFTGLQLWLAAVYGIWLAFWKSQQMLYDLINGQIGSPDALARR
jgi:hypothetical protein